MDSLVMHIKL